MPGVGWGYDNMIISDEGMWGRVKANFIEKFTLLKSDEWEGVKNDHF